MISAGEFVRAGGSWINDRTHGVQFRASFLKATAPTRNAGFREKGRGFESVSLQRGVRCELDFLDVVADAKRRDAPVSAAECL
jgi:hypothetical protein